MVWIAVRQRFSAFAQELSVTSDQWSDGWAKHVNVGRSLERSYYGQNAGEYHPGFMVGSWGKQTQVRPPRDVDTFFILPSREKQRFDARVGNVQSALLQEVKQALLTTFPQTDMRGDGQVVSIAFNTITVEVVPVFAHGASQFLMPDANGGGAWKLADPLAQMNYIDQADKAMNGNVRALAKMMKLWKRENRVPLKSFIVELLVAEFLPARGNGFYNYYWYDFYVRDFFAFLVRQANTYITIPGTFEQYYLGSDWLSKAESARDVALQACAWEYHDYDVTAGQEWQKIFGSRIPIHVAH
jgi:hypothetical protein